jgi:hypothetical protein
MSDNVTAAPFDGYGRHNPCVEGRMSHRSHRIMSVLALVLFAGCSSTVDGTCACTEEFRYFTVTVLDDASQPAQNVALTRTNLRTGKVLEPGWLGLLVAGTYLVADDGQTKDFSTNGDTLRVTGTQGGASFTADFVFAADACGCHLQRVAGPDTVIIGEQPPAR